jgi:polyhydroxyalkanoate synthase
MATDTEPREAARTPRAADGRAPGGASAGLDVLLTDATRGPLRRLLPGRAAVKLAAKLLRRPDVPATRGAQLAAELARIGVGRSDVAPPKRDRRFKDPAWQQNPAFKRLLQTYLATGQAIDGIVCDAELDWRSERQVRFALENVLDALAPTNAPATNPAVLKTALDTGGRNFLRGAANLARDMSRPPRIPTMVDRSAFEVGRDIAVTPGSVVLRTPVFELIQYRPQTPKVHEKPLLLVPPMINKYYIADLAPSRSMLEHAVQNGHQTFAMSWRNPDARHRDWNLDTYAGAVLDALGAVEEIAGGGGTQVLGLCAGGIVLTTVLAHLAANDELDRIAGLTLGVCVLDQHNAGTTGAFMAPGTAVAAVAESARKGYLSGRSLAGVFAWLRPNDLVWNYWVSNYLMGREPPAFDILFWNSDTTNMPAGLHADFVRLALENSLTRAGEATVLGTPVDLSRIDVDTYLVAGIADHITPWQNAYRTVNLLGSRPRFILSTSGHIAALVNPPGNEKASYRCNDELPEEPEEWLASATTTPGSWWGDWMTWLGERSGDQRGARRQVGGKGYRPLEDAPGSYVKE